MQMFIKMKIKVLYKDSIVDRQLVYLHPPNQNSFQTFTQTWCFHITDVDIFVRCPGHF